MQCCDSTAVWCSRDGCELEEAVIFQKNAPHLDQGGAHAGSSLLHALRHCAARKLDSRRARLQRGHRERQRLRAAHKCAGISHVIPADTMPSCAIM